MAAGSGGRGQGSVRGAGAQPRARVLYDRAMDPTLYERDLYTWTQVQAEALRRLAERRENLDAEIDLGNLIEEIEDLGREQVGKVRSHLVRLLEHLIYLANAPNDDAVRHWRGEALVFRDGAVAPYLASMRQTVEAKLERAWRAARQAACAKLGRPLPHLSDACPFTLAELLDEDAPLEPLIARLAPPEAAR